MSIAENLDYLYSLTRFGIKTGLDNIRKLCESLGNPQDTFPIIHVAGTNGKGTTCATLAKILQNAGFKTGLYTSPHLVYFGERIRVNDRMITDAEISSLIDELKPLFDETGSTFFESTTAMAFLYFARQKIDIAVIETGLGGSLDATNVVNPLLSVFTPISYDHTERLGKELTSIASDKAGIIKYGCAVVSSQQEAEGLEQLKCRAKSQNSEFHYAPEEVEIVSYEMKYDMSKVEIICKSDVTLSDLYKFNLPGRHHFENLQTVISAIAALRNAGFEISEDAVMQGIETVTWPGRLEIMSERPLVFYDVAHNPSAAKVVARFFEDIFPERKIKVIMGIVQEKDIKGVVDALNPIASEFILVDLDNPRSMNPRDIAPIIEVAGFKYTIIDSPSVAIEQTLRQTKAEEEIILIMGSHYLGEHVYRKDLIYS